MNKDYYVHFGTGKYWEDEPVLRRKILNKQPMTIKIILALLLLSGCVQTRKFVISDSEYLIFKTWPKKNPTHDVHYHYINGRLASKHYYYKIP